MRKILAISISLAFLTAGTALAAKGGNKPPPVDLEAELQAETDARIAADADLQSQINDNVLGITDNAANIQANTNAINALSGGGGLKVYDADGQFLGILVELGELDSSLIDIKTFDPISNQLIRLQQMSELTSDGNETFQSDLGIDIHAKDYFNENCQGTQYVRITHVNYLIYDVSLNKYYIINSPPLIAKEAEVKSRNENGVCVPYSTTSTSYGRFYEITEIEPPFNIPVSTPLRFEP